MTLMIAIPTRGKIRVELVRWLLSLKEDYDVLFDSGKWLSESRNRLTQYAIDSPKYTELLFVDDDCFPAEDNILYLMRKIKAKEKADIVCLHYALQGRSNSKGELELGGWRYDKIENKWVAKALPRAFSNPLVVGWAPFGFSLHSLKYLRKLKRKNKMLWGNKLAIKEDTFFGRLVYEDGGKIVIAPYRAYTSVELII